MNGQSAGEWAGDQTDEAGGQVELDTGGDELVMETGAHVWSKPNTLTCCCGKLNIDSSSQQSSKDCRSKVEKKTSPFFFFFFAAAEFSKVSGWDGGDWANVDE